VETVGSTGVTTVLMAKTKRHITGLQSAFDEQYRAGVAKLAQVPLVECAPDQIHP